VSFSDEHVKDDGGPSREFFGLMSAQLVTSSKFFVLVNHRTAFWFNKDI
jgi:hypothetical protein